MAFAGTVTATLAVAVVLIVQTVLGAPVSTNNDALIINSKPSISLPRPLDVRVVYVKDGEYKLVVDAEPDVTDVTTTVSLNKVVTEATDGVEVLQLIRDTEGGKWTSPPIRAKLSNKDVLHLGVHFVQEGKKEAQTVNYFEMKMFDAEDKLNAIKHNPLIKETPKNIKKRAITDSSDDEADSIVVSMTMIPDEDGQQLSERWGAHGRHHGPRGGDYYGNTDFIQIPFLPVNVPSPMNNAFGLLGGFFGGENRDQDAGHHRNRPGPSNRPNHDWDMDDDHHHDMNGWSHGHGHNHNYNNRGNNGRWPDRRRPHNNNCHHRDSSDESNDNDSDERPYSSTKRPGPTRRPWPQPTTSTTTRYTTRTTTTRTTTPTTTTEQIYDIDIRFGQGQPKNGTENAAPKPDGEKNLPEAV